MAGAKTLLPKTWGGWLNVGASAVSGFYDYSTKRDEGEGVLSSMTSAASEFALSEMLGFWGYLGYTGVSYLGELGVATVETLDAKARQHKRDMRDNSLFRNHTFVDAPQLYTMRQAGMALAKRAKYATEQTTIGNEARYLHR